MSQGSRRRMSNTANVSMVDSSLPSPSSLPHTSEALGTPPSSPASSVPEIPTVWEHAVTNLMNIPITSSEGINIRLWIQYQELNTIDDLLFWDLEDFDSNLIGCQFETRKGASDTFKTSLKHNTVKQLIMLWKYIRFLSQDIPIDAPHESNPLTARNFLSLTSRDYRAWRLAEITSCPVDPPSHLPNTRRVNNNSTATSSLLSFKRAIKRDINDYQILKDEKYFESFKRSLKVTARMHGCEEILDPNYRPPNDTESQELFQLKQDFMFSVFNNCLKNDMGKTLVRRHVHNMNAQMVWADFDSHMTRSSKGRAEKRRLHTYVTTTILDRSWRGTTEQFVLHFHEQFRQLEDISEEHEILSASTKLTLLQTAVQAIPELRIVETMEEFRCLSNQDYNDNSMDYDTYLSLLQNACIRYDKAIKTKPSPAARAAYQHDIQDIYHDFEDLVDTGTTYGGIDTPAEDFYRVNTTNRKKSHSKYPAPPVQSPFPTKQHFQPPKTTPKAQPSSEPRYKGPIYLPSHIFRLMNKEALMALKAYNEEARSKYKQERGVHVHETTSPDDDSPPDTPPEEHLATDVPDIEPDLENSEASNAFPIDDNVLETLINQYSVNMTKHYHVSKHSSSTYGSLVDRGANGGLAGADVRVLERTGRSVTVTGIDNHELPGLDIVTCAALISTNHGKVNLIMHEYAYYGRGSTIHSPGQIEWFKNICDDKSCQVGGKQVITFLDGYATPLQCRSGLIYMALLGKPTDEDLETYPHVLLTSPHEWDPSVLDYTHPDVSADPPWAISPSIRENHDERIDEYGEYRYRSIQALSTLYGYNLQANKHQQKTVSVDYDKLRPYFGWVNAKTIENTFKHSTQWEVAPTRFPMCKHFKSRFPAFNIPRRSEPVATDTIFSDTPAVDSGVTMAQIFIGKDTLVADVYPMKSTKQFVNTLEDNIRFRGAMSKLISDYAQVEISNKVKDILRMYHSSSWFSEPYHQNQNPAEGRYRTIKSWTNTIMNRSGAPADCWLLCMSYVCYLLNHISCESLKNEIPLAKLYGVTPDISIIMLYTFYQEVYYASHNQSFPSSSEEKAAHWVGFGEHVGDALTHKLLDLESRRIIYRSAVRPSTPQHPNKRLMSPAGESSKISPIVFVRSRHDNSQKSIKPMPSFDPDTLIGRTFLMPPTERGERLRATIKQQVISTSQDLEESLSTSLDKINFLCQVGQGRSEAILSYNQILDYLEQEEQTDNLFKFRCITNHLGPLTPDDPNYKGSSYNVMVEWETGEITEEPLSIIAADDPVTCAIYAKEHNLLHLNGWKRFKNIAKNQKTLARAINQSKIRQVRRSKVYQFGYLIPRDYKHALELDELNGNSRWYDATKLEMDQIHEYHVFKDHGKAHIDNKTRKVLNAPKDHQKIRVHLIFAVKHDGRHKARLVAGGHLTPDPIDSIYSGVVSIRSLRLVILLGKLNRQELWGADIGNAYLEAITKEKLYIIGGAEFDDLAGHILVIHKALYGLKSSGLRWSERLHDVMVDIGFKPSKADSCVWMRKASCGLKYEYIAIYVDDLLIASDKPSKILELLKSSYKFKIKGEGPLTYHLGCDYHLDPDGTLVALPKKYINKILDSYVKMFPDEKLPNIKSPLDKNDHPELDNSDFANEDLISKYMCMIGQLQWLVTLGRFDILAHVMSMSRFRLAPRIGHIERLKRIYGYLSKTKHYAIRYRTYPPDYSQLPVQEYDWSRNVYGQVQEEIPSDVPTPLGEPVVTTTFFDANLMHDITTGKSVTAVLHFANTTPFDWYSKRQATVENSTYGSEFVAARTATEQIIELRHTLRYLGVPINSTAYMFGDNKSVVTNATIPHSVLSKRHNILSYHRVREAIAAKILAFYWCDSSKNKSDILSKHWDNAKVFSMINELFDRQGKISLIKF